MAALHLPTEEDAPGPAATSGRALALDWPGDIDSFREDPLTADSHLASQKIIALACLGSHTVPMHNLDRLMAAGMFSQKMIDARLLLAAAFDMHECGPAAEH